MGELGVPEKVISLILNHKSKTVTGRHYDHARRLREKRRALNKWAAELSLIIGTNCDNRPAPTLHGQIAGLLKEFEIALLRGQRAKSSEAAHKVLRLIEKTDGDDRGI
jgi:hypothetical protein